MKKLIALTFLLTAISSFESCLSVKVTSKKKNAAAKATEKPDPKPKKDDINPYDKVITKDAKSDDGLFKVHNIDNSFFYEIPDTLFDKEMLMVTRISKTASGVGFGGGKQKYAGS